MLERLASRCSRWKRTPIRAIYFFVFLTLFEPCCLAQYRSSLRMIRSRARDMQTAQRREVVSSLQSQLRAANRELSEAQSQLTATQSDVRNAKSQRDAAKKQEADQRKAVQEATRSLRAIEEKIVSTQPAETPLGRVRAELAASQKQLNAEFRRVLGEGDSEKVQAEFNFSSEYQKLNQVQREKLKEDAAFQAAQRRVDGAKYDLERLKKQLLDVHPEWKGSRESVQAMGKELDALKEARKSAASDLARATRNLTRVRAAAILAQSKVNHLTAELAALGASPN